MHKEALRYHRGRVAIVLSILFLGSCAPSKTNYNRKYNRVWKQIVKSEEWKNSLLASNTIRLSENPDPYTGLPNEGIIGGEDLSGLEIGAGFRKKYHSLVSRAYFKIITEAEKADLQLEKEYRRWNTGADLDGSGTDLANNGKLEMVNRRYHAHKEMLRGLKSWNIYSENRTDDLKFFKKEYIKPVHEMYQNGKDDTFMIDFLVYRLADLYHLEQ